MPDRLTRSRQFWHVEKRLPQARGKGEVTTEGGDL